jgi:hypothetical protein
LISVTAAHARLTNGIASAEAAVAFKSARRVGTKILLMFPLLKGQTIRPKWDPPLHPS